jgi:uncharacterized OB-fold protein
MTDTDEGDIGTDPDSDWFWQRLARGEALVPLCGACGHTFFPPMPACPNCGSSDVRQVQTSGVGDVYSWVRVHIALDERFADEVPYTIVAVDLDGGARMIGRLIDEPTEVVRGLKVALEPYARDGAPALGFRASQPPSAE